MSCPIHFISTSTPGYGTVDAICLSRSNTSRGDYTLTSCVSFSSSRRRFRNTSLCNASPRYYRRNPNFSRQNRNGFSRSKNQPGEDSNGYDGFEESDFLTSKGEPLLGKRKLQTAASPGSREKKIVELFRKVQVQLRERSAVKEEKKKVENSKQGTSRENDIVDSLLKIFKKHSVHPEQVDNTTKNQIQESPKLNSSHPELDFSIRLPVPEMKSETQYHESSSNLAPHGNLEAGNDDVNEIEVGYAKSFVENSDNGEEDYEQKFVEVGDVSGMKLAELKSLAKSRGVKGFSKLKKKDIIELLSGISI